MGVQEVVVLLHRVLAPESKSLVCSQYCIHSAWCATWHMVGVPYLLDESRWKVGAVWDRQPKPQPLNHVCKSQAYASICHWSVVTSLRLIRQCQGPVLPTTYSGSEAATKPCISLYGLTALALVKGWEVLGSLWDSLSGLLRLVFGEHSSFLGSPKLKRNFGMIQSGFCGWSLRRNFSPRLLALKATFQS